MAIETPKSVATRLRGTLFFSRQLRNAVAKLPRISQWSFDSWATAKVYPKFASQGKELILPVHGSVPHWPTVKRMASLIA